MNEKDTEELALAMVSAYVWVASSDEGVDVVEYNKFKHVLIESPFATQFSMEELSHTFKDMVEVFITNFEYGIELTKKRISKFAQEPIKAEEILRLSRAAAVANSRLDTAEENVLTEICKELGIKNDMQ